MSTTLLAFIAVILFFAILFLIAKASEASNIGRDKDDVIEEASSLQSKLLVAFLVFFIGGIVWSLFAWGPRMLPQANSVHGDWIDSMFNITTAVAFLVVLVVQVVLIGFVYLYRYRKDRQAVFFPHSNKLEIIWTVVPAIVLTFLVFRGLAAWDKIFHFDSLKEAPKVLVIEATAKQFGWILRYPGVDGQFGERIIDKEHISPTNELGINWEDKNSLDDIFADEIVLIKGVPTKMKLGAQDVLHSFYLPHFRVKMDCVPGMPTQFMFTPKYTTEEYKEILKQEPYWQKVNPETGNPKWQDFTFELACAELCGKSHFAMQKNVRVVTQEEYDKWLKEGKSYYYTVINPDAAPKVEAIEAAPVELVPDTTGNAVVDTAKHEEVVH